MRRYLVSVAATLFVLGLAAAAIAHPRVSEMERVSALAQDLADDARHVYDEAEATALRGITREAYALDALHTLALEADNFHAQTERYYRDPERTEADFRALAVAYDRSRDRLEDLHGYDRVYRDFSQVDNLMDELFDLYRDHDR